MTDNEYLRKIWIKVEFIANLLTIVLGFTIGFWVGEMIWFQ